MINRKKLDEDTIAARIPVKDMIVDEYQGHVNKKLVEFIATNWDDDAAGAVVLNLRENNTYAVLDGQHRVLAARVVGKGELDSLVHIGKTPEEEAVLFVKLNKKHNVQPMDRFRANLFAGSADETQVSRALREVGLDIAIKGPANRRAAHHGYATHIQCVGAVMDIYRSWGIQHFKTVIGVLSSAYKNYDDPKAYVEESFKGLSQFIARYPQADLKRVITKLSGTAPVVMLGMAAVKKDRGQENAVGWGKALTSIYNSGYRTGSSAYLPMELWEKKVLSPAAKKARAESTKVQEQIKSLHTIGTASRFKPGVDTRRFSAAAKTKKTPPKKKK